MRWFPAQTTGLRRTTDLVVGDLVALDRQPWVVVSWHDRPFDLWPRQYASRWEELRLHRSDRTTALPGSIPTEWPGRPVALVLSPPRSASRRHLEVPADHQWHLLPEHYAICVRCQEIPPCGHVQQEQETEDALRALDHLMQLLPGNCHACHEPVTTRQQTIRFCGPNLLRPDFGDGTAIFHARKACRSGARAYDERWATETGRPRRLSCQGNLTIHANGEHECDAVATCPGTDTDHQSTQWHFRGVAAVWSGCWCVSGDLPPEARS